jgi:signal transduction histidine kinase
VTVAGSAEEALEAHLEQPFQLMLVDWTLPGMSGLDLCRMVRSRPGGDAVVILVITGRNRAEDLNAVLDAGASDYLSKPIDPEVLGTRLLIAERTIQEADRRAAERQDMESRLAFAGRMASVGTLAAGVAHELNNPLMYVLSNLHLTREEIDSRADAAWLEHAREQLDEAIHGAVRMQNIVRDLKTFSRVDDEQQGNVDVQSVLESSINICWNEVRHRATLERDFSQIPPVDANESRLGQVFLNLLINAAQAMPERGVSANRITVRTFTDEQGWAVIEVADNGTGIEPGRMTRVFEPFFTTKPVSEGTGLGLSICRNIVREAGGTIEAHSELDRGTTFVVRLPASTRDSVPHTTLAPPTATPGVSSGEEAIERLCSDEPFDVVFCDLMMPEVSGMELFARVSERCPEVASRFVFMTGGAFTPQAREFLKQTPLVCLEKPFELRQIRDLVKERAEPAD